MLTISKPPVGALAWGRSGVGCIIEALEANRIILKTPSGLKRVPFDAVIRWELPAVPKPIQIGDRVRLKNTALEFVVVEIYDLFTGLEDGERTYETWARLKTSDDRAAFWKLSQVEVLP
jgi:hypothetical protein